MTIKRDVSFEYEVNPFSLKNLHVHTRKPEKQFDCQLCTARINL